VLVFLFITREITGETEMALLKEIWHKTSGLLSFTRVGEFRPKVGDEGLLESDVEEYNIEEDMEAMVGEAAEDIAEDTAIIDMSDELAGDGTELGTAGYEKERSEVICAGISSGRGDFESAGDDGNVDGHLAVTSEQGENQERWMSRLEVSFGRLADELSGINENLRIQAELEKELSEQMRVNCAKSEEFCEVVGQIPAEAARQSEVLGSIAGQLCRSQDSAEQMAGRFEDFNKEIRRLSDNTECQRDGILQMSRSYMTSDRYMKYLITKQNKRFAVLFVVSLGVCLSAVCVLAGIVIYVLR